MRLEDLLPELFYSIQGFDYKDVIDPLIERIINIVDSIKKKTKSNIFINNFLLPRFIIHNIGDYQNMYGQSGVIYCINQKLKELANKIEGVYIFDLMSIASEFGINRIYDDKMFYLAAIPYKADFMKYLGYKFSQYSNALFC